MAHPFQPGESNSAICAVCRLTENHPISHHEGAVDWDAVPWTKFWKATPPPGAPAMYAESTIMRNSRYEVLIRDIGNGPLGRIKQLSIKTLDKAARHDWRDFQRIKNELIGPQYEAIEIYPAEDRLVDTSNQYWLWVFLDFKFPFGFDRRLVCEDPGEPNARQRPWPADARPSDLMSPDDMQRLKEQAIRGQHPSSPDSNPR